MRETSIKEKAINLRKKGYSYNMISGKLGLAKSTLNNWLVDIPYTPNKEVIKRIGKNRERVIRERQRVKLESIKQSKKIAKKDVGTLTKRDLFMLGIGLYWGEGHKRSSGSVGIVNSDPEIINLAIEWFKDACGVKVSNFAVVLHTYPDNNISEDINYWSKTIRIPKNQFRKTQIDRRTNKSQRKKKLLPHGTISLLVRSNGEKELGIFLFRRIMEWIHIISNQTNKRV